MNGYNADVYQQLETTTMNHSFWFCNCDKTVVDGLIMVWKSHKHDLSLLVSSSHYVT